MLEELNKLGRFLKQSKIEEIDKNSKKYIPEFLEILKKESENPQDPNSRAEKNDYLYAMYFLAKERVIEAEKYILKLFSREGNYLNPINGDFVLQNLPSILASVYSGNLEEYIKIVLDPNGNEYSRASILEAVIILTYLDKIDREKINPFFKELFLELEKEPIFVHSILVQGSALLFNKLHSKEILKSFSNNLIDELFISTDEIEEFWSDPENAKLNSVKSKWILVEKPISEMNWWANFSE